MNKNVRGFVIWLLATTYYCFDNMLFNSIGVMIPELSLEFNVSAAAIGSLAATYLWGYGLMQLPAGLLFDKFGPRKVLTTASLICTLGVWLFYTADGLMAATIGRFLIGVGAGFAVTGAAKVSVNWFSSKQFALLLGLTIMLGMFGSSAAVSTTKILLSYFNNNWRLLMHQACITGGIITILIFSIIRDKPNIQNTASTPSVDFKILNSLKCVICSMQAWYAAIYAGLMFIPAAAFAGLWGPEFLSNGLGLERELSGKLFGLFFTGLAFGAPAIGWFSDCIKLRKLPMYLSSVVTLIVSLIIIYIKLPIWLLGSLLFIMGFFSTGFMVAFVIVRENNTPSASATSVGFMNTLNTISAGLGQILVGISLDKFLVVGGDIALNLQSYRQAFILFPILLFIACICVLFIKETHCHNLYE